MKRNSGFTLVELLAVIVVLALIMTIAIPSVLSVRNSIMGKLSKEQERNLTDAGKLLGIDLDDYNSPIYECKVGSWVTTTSGVECTKPTSGWTEIKVGVKDLVDNGYFKDEKKHCEGFITVSKTNSGYKVATDNVTC